MTDIVAILDLYCRMGGSTFGYQRALRAAGLRGIVIGVDINPQPGYPGDEFIQSDALGVLRTLSQRGGEIYSNRLRRWMRPVLIHTGPPCQGQNTATASNRARGIEDDHPSLVVPTRDLLNRVGIPYVIEQPTSSVKGTIRRDVTLCMDMFKGDLEPPWVQKHRSFEFGCWEGMSWPRAPKHDGKHGGLYVRGWRHGVNRQGAEAPYVAGYGDGGGKATAEELRHAMGIDWMTDRFDLCEAIPPAYTEWLGTQFLASFPNGQ